jgi:hypothetical protein
MSLSERGSVHGTLSPTQLAGIRAIMRTFVTDDLDRGVSPEERLYCDACEQARSQPGFLAYGRYQLCNACATAYEVAWACGEVATPGRFVRNVRFGEVSDSHLDGEEDATWRFVSKTIV